ncbi:porin family protein [Flavobacterium sp. RSB2_4_14]|uniref:porin family protein n=1 Tax=Flavobacterium sp. RSB2_4_14 TaxID=3447665 RepID=UPI003F366DE5
MSVLAQKDEIDFDAIDSLYREDQFYINFTYNSLKKTPDGFSQNKFSTGLAFGFLRDMPINKDRTIAIAAGLGYTFSAYNQNLVINTVDGNNFYSIIGTDVVYSKDKLTLHFVDLPIEFRWRTSTPESHKFWRIYTGIKLSYLFYDTYKFESTTANIKSSGNTDLNAFHYGAYASVGWNTWNIYMYYGFNPLFKSSAKIDDKSIEMSTLNIGLMFYIL